MLLKLRVICAVCCAVAVALVAGAAPADETGQAAPRYTVAWATYLGGDRWDQAREIIPLADGSLLVGAQSASTDMPTTDGCVQPKYAGEYPDTGHGGIYRGDLYIARLSGDGRKLLAATYLGGSKQERNTYGFALDSRGNLVVCTATRSPDCPTTEGCFQKAYGGAPADWMVAKLAPDLKKLLWCTYVGGSGDDFPRGGLAVDADDNVVIVGGTASRDFPTTAGAFQAERCGNRDAAVAKLKADGSGLVWCTLLGGGDWDGLMGVRVGKDGACSVGGHTRSADFPVTPGAPQATFGGQSDAFLARLSADGSKLLWATYLGGKGNEFAEHPPLLLADGSVILAGVSASDDFPTTGGAVQRQLKGKTDGFITKLSADGRRLVFSSLLGGSGGDFFLQPQVDGQGNVYVVGQTSSRDFPTTPDALQKSYGGGASDGLLAVLSPDGATLLYATYLGGSGGEMTRSVALTPDGAVWLVGNTASKDFPVTSGALQTKLASDHDTFVVKLVPGR